MTYSEAMLILDQRRNGQEFSQATINKALEMTGDLDHIPFSLANTEKSG